MRFEEELMAACNIVEKAVRELGENPRIDFSGLLVTVSLPDLDAKSCGLTLYDALDCALRSAR